MQIRIPFPERIEYWHALVFATGLAAIELLEKSDPVFVGVCFCFMLVATAAFNVAGGIFRPSGTYVAFNAVLTMVLPLSIKALTGQVADRNLHVPVRTAEVYLCGAIATFAAAAIASRMRRQQGYLSYKLSEDNLKTAYYGCAILGVTLGLLSLVLPGGAGSLGSFILQINYFPAMTILLGVTYTIRRTGGKRSMSWPLLLFILNSASAGIFTFSKEAFLYPFYCWLIPVAVLRYPLRLLNIVLLVAGGYLVGTYMVPYANVARHYANDAQLPPREMAYYLLTHMDEVRELNAEQETAARLEQFYDYPISFVERVTVFGVDDLLVETTDNRGTFGYRPIIASFQSYIPHFLWPDKPIVYFGNDYGREVGVISTEDVYTGISFSASADAYHQGRLVGVFLVQTLVLAYIFIVLDSVLGDYRLNPVAVLGAVMVSRAAEEALYSMLYMTAQPLFAILLISFVCTNVLPIVGGLFVPKSALQRVQSGAQPGPQPV